MGKRIGDFAGRSNNLGLAKWIAAILVIYSHSFSIVGSKAEPMLVLTGDQLSFGGIAVSVFFFASGFYVTKSLRKKKNGLAYVRARVGKIYPAWIAVMLLTAFVLGPVVTELSVGKYFTSVETYTYLLYLLMIPHYYLPGVFEHNPVQGVVNAPLWTLVLEAICYAGLFIAWKLKLLEKKRLKWISVAVVACAVLIFAVQPSVIYTYNTYLRPLFIFIAGMIFCVFADEIRLCWAGVAAAAVIGGVFLAFGWIDMAILASFPMLLSALFFAGHQVGERVGRLGDYSYGMYLSAYPIQQTLSQALPQLGAEVNCVLTVVLSMAAAWVLRRWIELPLARRWQR